MTSSLFKLLRMEIYGKPPRKFIANVHFVFALVSRNLIVSHPIALTEFR